MNLKAPNFEEGIDAPDLETNEGVNTPDVNVGPPQAKPNTPKLKSVPDTHGKNVDTNADLSLKAEIKPGVIDLDLPNIICKTPKLDVNYCNSSHFTSYYF